MSASHPRARQAPPTGSLVPAWVKETGRAILRPVVRGAQRIGLTPNGVTVLGLLITLAAAVLVGAGQLLIGAAVLTGGSLLDAVDGALARARGGGTAFGGFLDSTLDRAGESLLYIGIAAYFLRTWDDPLLPVLAAIVALAGSFLVSYSHARAQGIGLSAAIGLAPRTERLVLVIAGVAAAGLGWEIGLIGAVVIVAVLAVATVIQRIWHVWRLTGAGAAPAPPQAPEADARHLDAQQLDKEKAQRG